MRAGAWTLGGHATGQFIRLGSNLIMTRLLVPEMFGVMALAVVLMVGMQMLSDLGLRQNIVQSRRGHDPAYINTAWTVQIVRGVLICLLGLLAAGGIALSGSFQIWPGDSVYAEPVLPYVLAVLSFNAFINGLESTKLATANRALAQGRVTLIDLASKLSGLAVMLLWAYADRSVWALVAGSLTSSVVMAILSHVALPGIANRLHWERAAFDEIFRFGKWIFVVSILGYLAINGDRLLLGGLIDAKTLGLYAIAFFMVSALRDAISMLVGNVAFPALSEVARERPEALKAAYYRFRLPVDAATLFAAGLLFAAGHLFIQALYDDRYLPAGHMFEVLSISLIEVRYSLLGQCFFALGKPSLVVPITVVRVIALYGLLPLAFALHGLEGALWVAGGSALLALPLTFYLKIRHGLFDMASELRVLPLLGAGYALGWLVERGLTGG